MRRLLLALVAISLSWPLLAQVTAIDQLGREVSVPQPVERIVSLYGVATYYLYALGEERRLVLGTYVGLKPDSPPWERLLSRDPDLPGRYSPAIPTLEEALKASPQLILASPYRSPDADSAFAPFGIPVLYLKCEDLAGMKGALALLGKVLGTSRAQALLDYLERQLNVIHTTLNLGKNPAGLPRVLFVGSQPFRVASGEMYQAQMITLAGGVPVTKGVSGYWRNVNAEQVLLWNPDVIFIAPYGKVTPDSHLADPVWQGVKAIQEKRVYKLPRVFAPWDIPAPESVLGILWMAEKLHPELKLDIAAEAHRFYREFFGYQLPAELLRSLGK